MAVENQQMPQQEQNQGHEEEPERKISDKILVWAIILIVLAFILIFSLTFFHNKTPLTLDEMSSACLEGKLDKDICYVHKGAYVFVKIEGLWYTRIESEGLKVGIPLHFNPGDLENIPVAGSYNHSLFNSTPYFYITFDPLGSQLNYVALATGEFDRNMLSAFGKQPIASCIVNETDACKDRPIITCTNTNEPVVYMEQSNKTAVIMDNNCIRIKGEGPDIVKATDRLLMMFYSIM